MATTSTMIDEQSNQALAARTAALQKARDEAINGYTQQQQALPQQYQPLRDQTSYQGAKTANAINEQQAAQGLFNSGRNVTAQTANATNTATNINTFDKQQQDQVNKLQQAIAQAQANYGYDLAGATAQTESEKLAAQIAQANTDRGFGLTQQQIDNQTEQFNKNFDQNAYQFGITSAQNQQQIDNQAAQSAASLALQQKQIENQVAQFAQSFGLSERQFAQAVLQQGLDNAFRDKQFEQDADQFAAQMNLSREQLAAQIKNWARQYTLDEAALYGYSGGSSGGGSSGGGSSGGSGGSSGSSFSGSTSRVYDSSGNYSDYDSSGRVVGGGKAGTEDWPKGM